MRYKNILAFIALLIIGQSFCQQQIQLSTQVGESYDLDLSLYFSLISNTFQISPTSKSATLDQPFTQVSQAVQVTYSPPVQSDQIVLNYFQQQRVEFTQTQTGFTVSLYLITKSASSVGVTLVASNTIPSKRATGIGKVTLIKQNLGFFTYSINNINQCAYFYITEGTTTSLQISIPGGSGLFQDLSNSYPVSFSSDNSIYFVNLLKTNGNYLNLFLLNGGGDFQLVSKIDNPCIQFTNYSTALIQTGLNLYLLCQSNDFSNSILHTINFGNNSIYLQSFLDGYQSLAQIGKIFDTQLYKGNLYIFHQLPSNQNILYLKKIFVSGINLIQSDNIAIQPMNFSGQYIKINILNEKFISVITTTQLFGFNPSTGQILTQFSAPVVSNFQLQSVIQAFEFSILTYLSNNDPNSYMQAKIKLVQPKLKFTPTDQAQVFTISSTNKLKTQTLQVTFNNLALDKPSLDALSILSGQQYQQMIAQFIKDFSYYNIEEVVIGSNLQITSSIAQTYKEIFLTSNLYSLSLLKQTTTDFYPQKQLDNSNKNKINLKSIQADIVNIYSTLSYLIVIESLTQNQGTERQITLAQVSSNFVASTATLSTQDQFTIPNPISNIDDSGFFTYVNGNQQYIIKAIIQTAITSYQFFDISTSCQQADDDHFSFAADIVNNIIIIFCKDQVSQVSYFYDQDEKQLVAQTTIVMTLNNLLTYPILKLQASIGVLTILDSSNNIFAFSYLLGYAQQKIVIPAQTGLTTLSVILYSQSFLLVLQDADKNISIKQYGYQIASDNKSATYLRQLNLSTIGNIDVKQLKPLRQFKTYDYLYAEEYLLINSSDQQTITLFRLNKIKAQNQLYQQFKLSFQLPGLNFLYFSENTIGIMSQQKQFTSYFLTEFITIDSTYQITDQSKFNSLMKYQFSNTLTINTNSKVVVNYLIQKDTDAYNAVIEINESNNAKIQQVQTYFTTQDIVKSKQQLSIDLQGLVISNLFGWEATYVTGIAQDIQAEVSQVLTIDPNFTKTLFDQIQLMDKFFATSKDNNIYIGDQLYATLEKQYSNCNLYVDQSTIKTISDEKTIQTSLTFNALCYSLQNKQLLLDNVQFEGSYDIPSQVTTFKSSNYTYIGGFTDLFTQNNLIVTKIYTDSQLGTVMLMKQTQNYGSSQLCKYTTDTKNLQLLIDCNFDASSTQINALNIIDSIWIQVLNNYLYISSSGYAYSNLVENIQSINLLSIDSVNQQTLCTNCNIISVGQSSDNNFFISLSDVQMVELTVSKSQDDQITVQVKNIFEGQYGLQFTGYGLLQNNNNYILVMKSTDVATDYYLTLYQSYNDLVTNSLIIQGSVLTQLKMANYSGVFKIFNNNGQMQVLPNSYPAFQTELLQLNISKQNVISLFCTSNKQAINGIGAYLQIQRTFLGKNTALPINVQVTAPKTNSSKLGFAVAIFSIIFIMFV